MRKRIKFENSDKFLRLLAVCLALFCYVSSQQAFSAGGICRAIAQAEWLGPYLARAKTPASEIEQAQTHPQRWKKPLPAEVPNFGISEDNLWFRLKFSCPELVGKTFYLSFEYPLIDHLDIWFDSMKPEPDLALGDNLPFAQRPLATPDFVVPITIKEQNLIYFRIQSSGSLSMPVRFWEPLQFQEHQTERSLILGAYGGLVLVMSLYNLFLFFSVRDRSYLLLAASIFLFGLYQLQLNGLAFQYFYPDSTWLANSGVQLAIALAELFSVGFGILFMHTEKLNKKIDLLLKGLCVVLGACAVGATFLSPAIMVRVTAFFTFPTLIAMIGTGIYGCIRGERSAYYFTIAWITFLVGAMVYLLKLLGVLPSNSFTNLAQTAGSTLEIILLSLALGDRINALRLSETKATNDLLTAALENENLIRDRNEVLANLNKQLEEQIQTIHENQRLINEKAAQIEIETKARFLLVSELAHKMNNSMNYLQTAQVSMQSTLDSHHDDVVKIFADQDSQDAEVQELYQHLESNMLILQSQLTMMRLGLDRSTQTMTEIRTLSGIDGYSVSRLLFYRIIEQRVKALDLKLGYSGAGRIDCTDNSVKGLQILSNEVVLGLAFDLVFHLWRVDLNANIRLSVTHAEDLPDGYDGVAVQMIGEPPSISAEDNAVFAQLKHLVKPYKMNIELRDQYRTLIFLFIKEEIAFSSVA